MDAGAQWLRDAILVAAWLTGVYLVYSMLNLVELHRREKRQRDADAMLLPAVPAAVTIQPHSGVSLEAFGVVVPQRDAARHRIALSLALQGFKAADIAQRCNMPVAESRRIVLLAKRIEGRVRPAQKEHGTERTKHAA